jgi:hypothetical protein
MDNYKNCSFTGGVHCLIAQNFLFKMSLGSAASDTGSYLKRLISAV